MSSSKMNIQFILNKKTYKKSYFCNIENCNKKARIKNLCMMHGGFVKCKIIECNNKGRNNGYCWSHRRLKICENNLCNTIAVSNNLCWAHGGGKRCRINGCTKPGYTQNQNLCYLHCK